MTAPADPLAVAVRVTHLLGALGILHTVGGSIAASFAGEPRSTVDIDVVVALTERDVASLVSALTPDFYVDEDAVRRAVRNCTSVNVIDNATMLKVDLFVAGGTPIDAEQLQRRLLVPLGHGVMLPIHPPEDILLQKLRWFRLGGDISDRQWRDIMAIVRVQGARLDVTYLQRQAAVLAVVDLLERALPDSPQDS